MSAYTQRLQHRWPAVAPDIVARLVGLYGSEAERMVEAMAVDPVLRQRCGPSAAVTRGEVDYAVRAEMVVTLEDFLERRSRLMLYGLDNGLSVAGSVAQMLGAAMGWSGAEIAEAVTRYKVHVRETNSFRAATAEVSAATRSVSLAPAAHA